MRRVLELNPLGCFTEVHTVSNFCFTRCFVFLKGLVTVLLITFKYIYLYVLQNRGGAFINYVREFWWFFDPPPPLFLRFSFALFIFVRFRESNHDEYYYVWFSYIFSSLVENTEFNPVLLVTYILFLAVKNYVIIFTETTLSATWV